MTEQVPEIGQGKLPRRGDLERIAASIGRARRPRFESVAPASAEELAKLDPSLREAAGVLDDPEVVKAAQIAVIDANIERLNAQLSEFDQSDN